MGAEDPSFVVVDLRTALVVGVRIHYANVGVRLLTFGFFLRHTAHLDLDLDVTFFAVLAVLTFTVFLFFVAAAA